MNSTDPIIDLRSDTVTRPTPAMRRAMADAVVGDDVFGDDPTVQELERRMARLVGKEAALFVPSGTMGNQLAVACQTHPGDEVLVESQSHIHLNEQGGIASNSGCLSHQIRSERGTLEVEAVEGALREEDDHVARVTLLCLENTHTDHGGTIVPLQRLRELSQMARARGVRVHLDGARLWNASIATGIPLDVWAAAADTVMMCFSKGLGAPIGSILLGSAALVREARRTRKRWGGGMRQVGVLAAACLHALDHHIERLADDHRRARQLAIALGRMDGVEVPEPETNTVIIDLVHPALERDAVIAALEARGVRMIAFGPRRLRAITHLDIDDLGISQAGRVFQTVVQGIPAM